MRRAILFGKLLAHGDFVARGLGPAERDALDRWLSASMTHARETHGEGFDALYDQALPWRFAWRGDDSPGWTGGALTPSIDAAGRRFPLLAGCAGLEAGAVAGVAAEVEALLYRALAEGWTADALAAAVATIGDDKDAEPVNEGWWTLGARGGEVGFAPAHVADRRPATLMRLMLTAEAT